jgi:predicted PurR-regulated permease PerM
MESGTHGLRAGGPEKEPEAAEPGAEGGRSKPGRPALGHLILGPPGGREPTVRTILRIISTVVLSALALYVVYRLRTPISYVLMAGFLAVVVSGPVAWLSRRMPRGLAIPMVYLGGILIPIMVGAILIPPAVRAASELVKEFPDYVRDLRDWVNDNQQLREINENFDLTSKLEDWAADAASHLDDAAGVLANLGTGLVGSIFALLMITILSLFMVARGGQWIDFALRTRPEREAEVIRRAFDRMAVAVGGYVGGALLQSAIAGVATFIVLSILGVPSPLALAVLIAVLDLIPLVGATIGAILVGIVTLFNDFPTVTIIWVVWAIVYQQFENYVVQPRIQGRAVDLDPFIIVIAALFGGTLLGIVGALIAIPLAAATQIGIREFLAYRRMALGLEDPADEGPDGEGGGGESSPAEGDNPAPAPA